MEFITANMGNIIVGSGVCAVLAFAVFRVIKTSRKGGGGCGCGCAGCGGKTET